MEPIAYRKKLVGKSNAHLMTFNDGKDYVVKYFQPGFEKTLANEWISYCLGRYLGLPIPFAKIVEIPKSFSSQNTELQMSDTRYQFASLYIPNCKDGHQVSNISQITNYSTLANIIVFDYWLYNGDRTRKNILLHEESEHSLSIMGDRSCRNIRNYNWHITDLTQLPAGFIKSATHEIMARFIEEEEYFYKPLELIQTIPIFLIEEIITMIPDEWILMKEEKQIVNTLVNIGAKKSFQK